MAVGEGARCPSPSLDSDINSANPSKWETTIEVRKRVAKAADWKPVELLQHLTSELIRISYTWFHNVIQGTMNKAECWKQLSAEFAQVTRKLSPEFIQQFTRKLTGICNYKRSYNFTQRTTCKDAFWTNLVPELLQHAKRKLTGISIYVHFCNASHRKTSKAADWANLPPELLQLTIGRLANLSDYTRFHSVCASWRSAACPADLRPQLPWLIFTDFYDNDRTTLNFFNPWESRVYNFVFPEINVQKWVYGLSHGWLVMIDTNSLRSSPRKRKRDKKYTVQHAVSLLNPITRAHIALPHLPQAKYDVSKALLCFNPSTISLQPLTSRQLMIVIWSFDKKLFFLRHGDDNWGVIRSPCNVVHGSMVYFEKMVYVVNDYGRLATIDIKSWTLNPLTGRIKGISSAGFMCAHLVEARRNLLLIAWNGKSQIQLFRLDQSMGQLKWVRTVDTGDITVLTSLGQSVSVPTQDFPNSRGYQIHLFGVPTQDFQNSRGYQIHLGNDESLPDIEWHSEAASVRSTRMMMPRQCGLSVNPWFVPSLC